MLTHIEEVLLNIHSVNAGDESENEIGDGRGSNMFGHMSDQVLAFEKFEYLNAVELIAVPILKKKTEVKRQS